MDEDDASLLCPSDTGSLPCLKANEVDTRRVPLNRCHNEFYFLADKLVQFIVSTNYFSYLPFTAHHLKRSKEHTSASIASS